ncbi:uncharacterized protein LOC113865996 [Abrus precatorius]|uniref:Uncharacterized protein LOC113865996 n=1 Tax=Abrus precatorius TaxID=3816 RepID=A0A8B8LJT8_ABRPR|nr:uncharacterized protein LOC113865996 [Abrus precatorius]
MADNNSRGTSRSQFQSRARGYVQTSFPQSICNTPGLAASHTDVELVPSIPQNLGGTTTLTSTQPPSRELLSEQCVTSLLPILGTTDSADKKIWLAPGAKHDYLPSGGPSKVISKIIESKFDSPWPTWTKVPQEVRNMWFEEFKKTYKWLSQHNLIIRSIFEHKGSVILKNIMSKLRRGKDKGLWITPDVKEELHTHWVREEFQKKSTIAKQNRAVDGGASLYTGGSVSAAVHHDRMIII